MNTRERAYIALKKILIDKEYSHKVLKEVVENPLLTDARDRRLVWEITLGVLRWLKRIDEGLKRQIKRYRKLPEEAKIVLRLGYYQLLFMDRIPPYSAVNETVEVAKKHLPLKYHKFTNAVLRKALKLPFPKAQGENAIEYAAVACSHPEWIVERWKRQFGLGETVKLMRENNKAAPFTLWVNVFHVPLGILRKEMKNSGIEVKPNKILPNEMLDVVSTIDVTETTYFKEGLITIQDVASRIVVKVLEPQPGESILDACAAPGIKTAQIALSMENKGKITAVELKKDRFELLIENTKRLGSAIVEPINADILKLAEDIPDESYDRILIDAPCSDLGTIRRRPELKWKRTPEDIQKFSSKQREILKRLVSKVKKNGIIVYSVCSFEKEETLDIVEYAEKELKLKRESFSHLLPEDLRDEEKEGYIYLLPHKTKSDGFFIAKFRR